jgi:histidinol dehydrogenase
VSEARLADAAPALTRLDLRGLDLRARTDAGPAALRRLLPRARLDVAAALGVVEPVCRDVAERGDAAVRDATVRFDAVAVSELRVEPDRLAAALAGLAPAVRAALEESARRARAVHTAQRPPDVRTEVVAGGSVLSRWLPVRRVGLYVPGGRVAYPSSVVMNVVPAQVAGVEQLAVASPPQRGTGDPHPVVLAACALLGVTEVYRVGGAQAVAMFAHGTASCPPVDLVTGPGNVYVAAAKRLVAGLVGIDSEAGPTEIAILADDSADPAHLAADLVAQAEHDPLAACLLVSPSAALLDAVETELAIRVAATPHRDRVAAALAGQSAAVLVDDVAAGVAVLDAFAAEHVEIQTADADAVALRIRTAGAVFVGPFTPVSLGDYLAGSNHVLPTGGTARHASGLSTASFLRQVAVVSYDRAALAGSADQVAALGGAEELPAHVEAVAVRLRADPGPGAGAPR